MEEDIDEMKSVFELNTELTDMEVVAYAHVDHYLFAKFSGLFNEECRKEITHLFPGRIQINIECCSATWPSEQYAKDCTICGRKNQFRWLFADETIG